MFRHEEIHKTDIGGLVKTANILNACGKDMAGKYDLHHWDNPFIKSFLIVLLCLFKNRLFMVYSEDSPVATFQIRVKGDTLYFEKLGTLPRESGRGAGSYCMKAIEQMGAELGCKKVSMEVYESSNYAIGFYRNRGYRPVSRVRTARYNEIVMEKII